MKDEALVGEGFMTRGDSHDDERIKSNRFQQAKNSAKKDLRLLTT